MTIDELLNYFSLTVIDDLDLNSIRANDLFSVSDKEGYKYKASIKFLRDAVKRNGNLAKFHKLNPYSLENIHNWIKVNNIPIKIVSQEYKGIKEKMIWECSICGEHYERSFGKILNGGNSTYYCLKCSTKKRTLERSYDCTKGQSSIESAVENYLIDNNIEFEKQKTFTELLSNNGISLRYDFYIPCKNILIEVDGRQYFEMATFGGISKERAIEKFKTVKQYDEMKNKYAEEHNIKLIRLWYKDFYVSKNYINILNKELIEMK